MPNFSRSIFPVLSVATIADWENGYYVKKEYLFLRLPDQGIDRPVHPGPVVGNGDFSPL